MFRSNKVIVPHSKRMEIMILLHSAHAGTKKIKARARTVMFWPNLSSDIEQFCKACKVCQKYKPRNVNMPLLSHVPALPWQVVEMDLFYCGGRQFTLMVDFYSFFFDVREMRTKQRACSRRGAQKFCFPRPWIAIETVH